MKGRCMAVLLALVLLSACGLSTHAKERASSLRTELESAEHYGKSATDELPRLTNGKGEWLKPYSEKEGWSDILQKANAEIAAQRAAFETKVQPLLKEDSGGKESELLGQIAKISGALKKPVMTLASPNQRAVFLGNVRAEFESTNRQVDKNIADVRSILTALNQSVGHYKGKHPGSAGEIDSRAKPIVDLAAEAELSATEFSKNRALHLRGKFADYDALAKAADRIKSIRNDVDQKATLLKGKLPELDGSWSKTLIDMKQRYFLRVEQVAWNKSSDANTEVPHIRDWVEVSKELYEKADRLGDDDPLAYYTCGWGSCTFNPVAGWDLVGAVGLNEGNAKIGWGSNSNYAEYWLEGYVKSYHRYAEERSGKITETDWIEVSFAEYEENFNDLGMTLQSKPFGKFLDELEDDSAPAGIEYVDNSKYGEWRAEKGKEEVWHFHERYRYYDTLNGSSYSRAEHRAYHSSPTIYYGGAQAEPSYGSASQRVRTSSRFARTDFARLGGFQESAIDMRSAGPSLRGGGPGGGGK